MPAARPSATKRGADTPLALLRAAEQLFSERGVDAVSLREIAAAAGQANHSAATYHFDNKRDLLNSILDRHSAPIRRAWSATLKHMDGEGRCSLEELVGLLVRSIVAKLDDEDGGCAYLLIVADLVTSRSFPLTSMPAVSAPEAADLSIRMMNHLPPIPSDWMQLRMMRVAAVLYCSIANYHSLDLVDAAPSREGFVADLISTLVAVIKAEAVL